jgi:hypothetical protein
MRRRRQQVGAGHPGRPGRDEWTSSRGALRGWTYEDDAHQQGVKEVAEDDDAEEAVGRHADRIGNLGGVHRERSSRQGGRV